MPVRQDPIAAARIGQVIWLLFCIGLCVLVAVFTWIPEYLILFCVGKGGIDREDIQKVKARYDGESES